MDSLTGMISHHFIHKIEKLSSASTPVMAGLDLPGSDIEGGKKGGSAVAAVFMVEAAEGFAVGQTQPALGALQRLNGGLFVNAYNQCVARWIEVKGNDVGGLAGKMRVGRKALAAPSLQANP